MMTRLLLFVALCLSPLLAWAQTVEITTRTCGSTIVTVNMSRPNSEHCAMSFVASDTSTIPQQAQSFAQNFLVPQCNDPGSPAWDRQGFSKFSNRLGWIVLGQSPLGEGCDGD